LVEEGADCRRERVIKKNKHFNGKKNTYGRIWQVTRKKTDRLLCDTGMMAGGKVGANAPTLTRPPAVEGRRSHL